MQAAHRHFKRIALLALACALLVANGCVAIMPTIPRTVAGYGREYVVLNEEGEPVQQTGLLVLWSGDLAACFPVENGLASVPKRTAVTFRGGWLFCPMGAPFIGYSGEFLNYDNTQIYALVPGYVPRQFGRPRTPFRENLMALGVCVNTPLLKGIELRLAEPQCELKYVREIVMLLTPEPEQLLERQRDNSVWTEPYQQWAKGEDDKAALELGRQYALERLKVLKAELAADAARSPPATAASPK